MSDQDNNGSFNSNETSLPFGKADIESNVREIQVDSGDVVHTSIERVLSQAVNLSPENVMHEVTCPFCSSPYREEAENAYFAAERNWKECCKFIENNQGIRLSKDVIENHVRFHMGAGVRELQKVEYIDRIKRLSTRSCSTLDRIALCSAIVLERILDINSIVPDGDKSPADIAKIKSAETKGLVKSYNDLLKLQASILGEMKTDGEVITLPRKPFIQIFTDAIADARSEEAKKVVAELLQKLRAIGIN